METLVVLKIDEILPIMEITNEYLKIYKLISNNEFNYMVRFYCAGDGKLFIIINNSDIKVIFNIKIENHVCIDKIYQISELYNILKGMKSYQNFSYCPSSDKLIFSDDAVFYLKITPLDQGIKDEVFNLDEKEIKEIKISELNNFLKKELIGIKNIITLKNNKYSNNYFYSEDDMVFNFYDVYIKKQKTLKFINSDIIGLQFLIYIFSRYENNEFNYGINENKYIFKSNNFYIEGHSLNNTSENNEFVNNFFDKFTQVGVLNLKLEFYNFINTIVSINPKSCLIFDDNQVGMQLTAIEEENNEFTAEFKIDNFNGFFVIKSIVLYKILNFILKNTDKLDEFELLLGESCGSKWLRFVMNDTIIITEIAADLESVDLDDVDEEKVFVEDDINNIEEI